MAQLSEQADPPSQITIGGIVALLCLLICILITIAAKIYIYVAGKRQQKSMAVRVGESTSKMVNANDLPVKKIMVAFILLGSITTYIVFNESGFTQSKEKIVSSFQLVASLIMNVTLFYFVCNSRMVECVKRKLITKYPFSLLATSRVSPLTTAN